MKKEDKEKTKRYLDSFMLLLEIEQDFCKEYLVIMQSYRDNAPEEILFPRLMRLINKKALRSQGVMMKVMKDD